jgi:glycolate oxidase FAD binding subunit
LKATAESRAVNTDHLFQQLAAIVGDANLDRTSEATGIISASAPAIAALSPGSTAEVVAIVQAAEAAGVALIPCGGGTEIGAGYPPQSDRPYLLLRSSRLNSITDFQPDDLTVTAEPGVTLAALQQHVASRRLFLALDVPLAEQATLGGIVSAASSGFWRPAYGAPRDLLIGMKAVMTGGIAVKGGGKVVKNVAGYDICKLFTGARGTMGFLTELTFKLRPLPEADRTLAWNAPDLGEAVRLGLELHHAQLASTFLVATNEPEGVPRLIVGLQGVSARVDWQVNEFGRRVSAARWNSLPNVVPPPELTALRDRMAGTGPVGSFAVRISMLPSQLPAFVSALSDLPQIRATVHCASGIVSLSANDVAADTVRRVKTLLPKDANVVWTRLDAARAEQEQIALFGETRAEFGLHRALKKSLDPQDTFSPGRFLGKL